MTRPAAHYTPRRRPGARQQWPPNDAWSMEDLVAEMQFWRTLAHLMPFTVNAHTPVAAPSSAIPSQRRPPHQERWDAYLASTFATARHGHRPYGAAADTAARRRQARD